MNKITPRFLLVAVILTAVGLFFLRNYPPNSGSIIQSEVEKTVPLSIKDTTLQVALADTAAKRERGLSGRASLGENGGLLFLFDAPARPGFWMKDMNFPLDIIWIDSGKKVAQVTAGLTPASYPQSYYPASPVQFVLEVNSGWTARHGISAGDQVSW